MYPAIFSRTYASRNVNDVLRAIRDDGFAGAQMNLSSFGMESLPDALDGAAICAGIETAKDLGLTLAALSGTYNMSHPDPAARRAIRPRFRNVLTAARKMGVPVVTLCTGSRNTADMWAEHPLNNSAEAWADFRDELDWALAEAANHSLMLAIEPEPGNVVRDARAARRLLDAVGAPHLGIVLDAANLIGRDGVARQNDIIAEAIDLLGAHVVLAHAKDIDASGKVVAPGRGAIDLAAFAAALHGAGFGGALVGHGFEAADSRAAGAALAVLCARQLG